MTTELLRNEPRVQNPDKSPDFRSKPTGGGLTLVIVSVCLLAVVVAGYLLVKHRAAAAASTASTRGGQPPAPVVLGTVSRRDVPIYLDGLGTVQAFNTVTVKPQVDGKLKRVAFTEGQDVKANDLLAEIDPAPFQAALDQAVAKKGTDQAQLDNARLDLKRYSDLAAKGIDTQQTLDTQEALVHQYEATVKADAAAVESAQVQFDYTHILSPLDGRTGIRLVDQGNVVHATDTNGLVVITQLKPISVVFTLPEQTLGELRQEMDAGRTPDSFSVLAVDRDNTTNLDQGTLAVIDNQIDTTTGTIKLKATFPNSELHLWPGQFVNVRLLLTTRKNGIVVPSPVVQRGPNGAYAFVVQGEGTNLTVKQQNLTVAESATGEPVVEGGDALVDNGLEPGQTVVVDGQYKLQDGSKILPAKPASARGANSSPLAATNP